MRATLIREWRQFRRLVRFSYGRLLDSALASRDIDAEYFALWLATAMALPPLWYAIVRTSGYFWLLHRAPERLEGIVLVDRLFFVSWALMAGILLAGLTWEALVPDPTDQRILGVLPVHSRTVAAARLAASLVMLGAFMAAVSAPAGVVYAVAGAVDPSIGTGPDILLGHIAASIAAGFFAFAVVALLRGMLVLAIGSTAAARAALLVQVTVVVLLAGTFLFLPGLLPTVVSVLTSSGSSAPPWSVPWWFLGIYAAIAGPQADVLAPLASGALTVLGGVIAAVVGVQMLPADINARRALEAHTSNHRRSVVPLVGRVAGGLLRSSRSRAILVFTLTTVLRSQRHLLVLASYMGVGLAFAGTRFLTAFIRGRSIAPDGPSEPALGIPLVLTFFLVVGLRAAFKVPVELPANWTFRLASIPPGSTVTRPTLLTVWLLAVLPISVGTFAVGAWSWGLSPGLSAALMHASSGVTLSQVVFLRWSAVPFACAHSPSSETMKVHLPLFLLGLALFGFGLDGIQMAAFRAPLGVPAYVAGMTAIGISVSHWRRRRLRSVDLAFEAPRDGVASMNLSGAQG